MTKTQTMIHVIGYDRFSNLYAKLMRTKVTKTPVIILGFKDKGLNEFVTFHFVYESTADDYKQRRY